MSPLNQSQKNSKKNEINFIEFGTQNMIRNNPVNHEEYDLKDPRQKSGVLNQVLQQNTKEKNYTYKRLFS